MNKFYLFLMILSIGISSFANKSNGEIYVDLQKLYSMKRVLYVAAHPDDENTRALAWLSLGEKAETAYFSLTRGDGGQNLIGNELSEDLGVLRTQELLSARSHDCAKQYFSRAVDFGYSKSAKESFELWGKEQLLADLVLMIRKFQPDVIITRFPPDKRGGHGHHTASALLAIEAFDKAKDPKYMPKQVSLYGIWETTSLYWNTSYWWDENIKDIAKENSDYLVADIGGYNPQLGMSYNEIGTLARSEHKCQGFGGLVELGSRLEYFKHLAGEKLQSSLFEKSKRTWKDLKGEEFEAQFKAIIDNFDFINVENNVSGILEILKVLQTLPKSYVVAEKIDRCKQILIDCLGLDLEMIASNYSFIQGDSVELTANIINRTRLELYLIGVALSSGEKIKLNDTLKYNQMVSENIVSSGNNNLSNPYWLNQDFINVFVVADTKDLGEPESSPSISASFKFSINNSVFTISLPVTYKWRDPSFGERIRPLIATPKFTTTFNKQQLLMSPDKKEIIQFKLRSFTDSLIDEISIKAPKGWIVKPSKLEVSANGIHSEEWYEFSITATKNAEQGNIELFNAAGEILHSYKEIAYDHITTQALFKKEKLKCTLLDVKINTGRIAYIKGAGDVVPQAIEQLGFKVDVFSVKDIPLIQLDVYQTIVLGIRIYNVKPELLNFGDLLNQYVEEGGNLIMQYNTAYRSLEGKDLGPYPFELSRNRVTEEDAEVTFLNPDHPILNSPNKISKNDFDNWVQERGLYFASNWAKEYEPLFSWEDEGEDPQHGALIVAKYGKGQFVYTGISFFRELPNGVIGAYRLFANLLSYQYEK